MGFADCPIPSQARLTAVVVVFLQGAAEQLDHPGSLRSHVSLFPLLLHNKLNAVSHTAI